MLICTIVRKIQYHHGCDISLSAYLPQCFVNVFVSTQVRIIVVNFGFEPVLMRYIFSGKYPGA